MKNKIFLVLAVAFFALTAQAVGNVEDALKDLSQATGENVATQGQAAVICDSEKYLTICAGIGKKYNLYDQSEIKQVDNLVNEIKGQIESELKKCQTAECLIEVAGKLSQKVRAKNPKLAEQAELSDKYIQKKQEMLELTREKDRELKETIRSGALQCGDGTMDGCGNFCLNPSADARTKGSSAIPAVCREIAQKYFGPEGVKHLESAYSQVGQVRDSYLKKVQNLTFKTIDGKTITKPEEIGRYMEEQGRAGNVEAVEKGMEFMVSNGFVKPEEKEFALKMVRRMKERGGLPDFDACSKNPEACRDFIPEEQRGEFESHHQVDKILRQELGFDPRECQEAGSNQDLGQKCFEGTKKALSKLETLVSQNPKIKFIVDEIKGHISRGDERQNRKDEFHQTFQSEGGPGGCRGEQQCFAYCSDPAHGPECIAFGAKQGVFKGGEAVERFEKYNKNIHSEGFPGQGPFEGFRPPGQDGPPPGQIPGFTEPGRGFQPPPGGSEHRGPSPECFAAIQRGDFVRAKEVCNRPDFTPVGSPVNNTPYPNYSHPPEVSYSPYPNPSGYPTPYPNNDPAAECAKSGGTWDSGNKYCKFPEPSHAPTTNTTYAPPPPTYSSAPPPPPTTTYDPSADCAKSGGTWNGSTCQYPTTETKPDPAADCASRGGTWDGSACKLPTSSSLLDNPLFGGIIRAFIRVSY